MKTVKKKTDGVKARKKTKIKMDLEIIELEKPDEGNCGSCQCRKTSHRGQFIELGWQVVRHDGPRAGFKGNCCCHRCAENLCEELRMVDDVLPQVSERGRKTDPLHEFTKGDMIEERAKDDREWGSGTIIIPHRHKVHLPAGRAMV